MSRVEDRGERDEASDGGGKSRWRLAGDVALLVLRISAAAVALYGAVVGSGLADRLHLEAISEDHSDGRGRSPDCEPRRSLSLAEPSMPQRLQLWRVRAMSERVNCRLTACGHARTGAACRLPVCQSA